MIKLENAVLASPEQMEFIIEGMRNPMNSWDKSDSYENYEVEYDEETEAEIHHPYYRVGAGDIALMKRLANAGTDHRKFMRMMPVYVRITAPLYWWKEFDTYKVEPSRNERGEIDECIGCNVKDCYDIYGDGTNEKCKWKDLIDKEAEEMKDDN